MTTAALYARISLDKTGEELGVERQQEACHRLAEARGLTVTRTYIENDTSAFHGKRPVFDQMLSEVGQFDSIIVWSADRLYRRLPDLERLVDTLGSTPVHAVMSGDIDLGTADGRLTARLLGSVASHESERKGERMTASRQQAIAKGRWMGAVPRGYTRTNGVMAQDPEWAPRVAEAVQRVLAGGSIHGVARDWGVRQTSVRRLLQSPAIAGLTSRHEPGQWEAIVPESDWWRLQALLSDRARPGKFTPRTENLSLLGGILRCEHGSTMRHMGGRYRADCSHCHVSQIAPTVDGYVSAWIIDRLGSPEAAAAFTVPEQGPDFRRIEELKARRGALASMVADGLLQPEDARKQLEAIKVELAGLETAARPAAVLPNMDPAVVVEVWDEMTIQEKRQVVRLLCTVTILPTGKGNVAKDDFSRILIEPI